MPFELWLAFTIAATVLLAVPGPTILLVTGFAIRHGSAAALRTVAGVVAGDALAMTLSLLGVGAVLAASAEAFTVLKLLGAGYLIYLGVKQWRAPSLLPGDAPDTTPTDLSRQAFVVTALNPKSIAFFVAFMPQFVTPTAPVLPQLLIMGTTFLVLAGVNAALYALLAGSVRQRIRDARLLTWANRAGGSMLVGAGVLTALLRRPA
ncbi:MAG: LysE family translocator [Pseudomonadota bacterium]